MQFILHDRPANGGSEHYTILHQKNPPPPTSICLVSALHLIMNTCEKWHGRVRMLRLAEWHIKAGKEVRWKWIRWRASRRSSHFASGDCDGGAFCLRVPVENLGKNVNYALEHMTITDGVDLQRRGTIEKCWKLIYFQKSSYNLKLTWCTVYSVAMSLTPLWWTAAELRGRSGCPPAALSDHWKGGWASWLTC